jgi:hypothetical protein
LKPALQNEGYAHRLEEQQEAYTSKCDARRLEYKPDGADAISIDKKETVISYIPIMTAFFPCSQQISFPK